MLKDRVVAKINTISCLKKVITNYTRKFMDCQTDDEWIVYFKEFGFLCRMAPMLCGTNLTLLLLSSWFSKLACQVCDKM